VEGDIEDVNGVLKITRIRVHYSLKVPPTTFPPAPALKVSSAVFILSTMQRSKRNKLP
jgi:16S rRNA A1518/A1519 N6-dimethyltransferase RsmA/KsgA/DIM1 with predicted DNA glycosylase/AP lyase activity